jgi:hypothetical protein
VTGSPPRVQAQVAKAHLQVLLDTGSTRSLISLRQFQQLSLGAPKLKLCPTEVGCISGSGQSLEIVGEVKVTLKIQSFSWRWTFLISKRLGRPPILGVDIISRTNMVLDLGSARGYFRFSPGVYFPFVRDAGGSGCFQSVFVSARSPDIRSGKLTRHQKEMVERLINRYPNVLTARLGLANLLEYVIQLLDKTPVRLAPYSLSPPKMQYLREHIMQLLKDGVIEPSLSNYSSPMFLVPKSEGTYRAVVNFRALNIRIAIESVPLPDIHSACHWFGKAKYFPTLDLNVLKPYRRLQNV